MKQFSPNLYDNSVVVTGLGAFSVAGQGVAELWTAVLRGMSLARWCELDQSAESSHFAVCSAPDVEPSAPELKRLRRMDRSVQLAGAAAWEAWNDAGLNRNTVPRDKCAVFVGTSRGPLGLTIESHNRLLAHQRMLPTLGPNSTIACLSGALSNLFEARGPCLTLSATCISSAAAIGLAAQQIATGVADVALAGGAEAPLMDVLLSQLESSGVLASHSDPHLACRPFDSGRNGTILGEGAAFLLLESAASAKKRRARIYARLAGWAIGSEGGERTGISGDNSCLQRIISDAVTMAGLPFEELDYINAHGTGTRLNDRLESHAIANLLGTNERTIPTSSTKAVTGHCMGAASAIEAVISVLALERECLPPSANCFEQDRDCPLELVVGSPRAVPVNAVLSNSAGFWGNNASLVFTRVGQV